MEKILLKKLFSHIKTGAFEVVFWDGTEEIFGEGTPFFKLYIRDKKVARKLFNKPTLVFGEAYADGRIELEGDIADVIKLIYLNKEFIDKFTDCGVWEKAVLKLRRPTIKNQKKDVCFHYDLSNEFFSLWLDPSLSYSCAYFKSPEDTLEQAQIQKIDHILKKLNLLPGETLLDIGSGWGWLIIRAAQNYGVRATGITVSGEQYRITRQRIEDMNLGDLVEVYQMDYREFAGSGRKFDKVVSVGMFEHVGQANMPVYMAAVAELLRPCGLSLLHTITHHREGPVNAWINKYIFPNGYIPSLRELVSLLPEYNFHLTDVESLRLHYAMTLDRWAESFEENVNIVKEKYGERFARMWRVYLRFCAGSFRYSGLSIHQILFSNNLRNDLPLTRDYLYAHP